VSAACLRDRHVHGSDGPGDRGVSWRAGSCAARGTHGHAGRSAAARERRAVSERVVGPVPVCTSALASPFQAPGLTIC